MTVSAQCAITAPHQPPLSPHLCNQETYDYLRSICSDVTVVQGDVDERAWPDTRVVTLGELRVGLCHGHQVVPAGDRDAVAMLQREMDADVLVLGGSHAFEAYKHEGRFVINPGSATGAFHPLLKDPVPGFVLLDIDGTKVWGVGDGMCTWYVCVCVCGIFVGVLCALTVDTPRFPGHGVCVRAARRRCQGRQDRVQQACAFPGTLDALCILLWWSARSCMYRLRDQW